LVEALCQKQKIVGSISDEVNEFFFFSLPSHTMALGWTQTLTEMSARNLSGIRGSQLALNVDNLTAICEPTV
jgi:hypothetical protein